MENKELAYLAGFFDGEGCCSVYVKKTSRNRPSHSPVVSVTNTVIKSLQPFLDYWGGFIYPRKKIPPRKQSYAWTLLGYEHVPQFLDDIIPYLRVKIPQAKLLKKLCALSWKPRIALPKELIKQREIITQQLHVLNRKGDRKD